MTDQARANPAKAPRKRMSEMTHEELLAVLARKAEEARLRGIQYREKQAASGFTRFSVFLPTALHPEARKATDALLRKYRAGKVPKPDALPEATGRAVAPPVPAPEPDKADPLPAPPAIAPSVAPAPAADAADRPAGVHEPARAPVAEAVPKPASASLFQPSEPGASQPFVRPSDGVPASPKPIVEDKPPASGAPGLNPVLPHPGLPRPGKPL